MSVAELSQAQLSLFFFFYLFNLNINCSDPLIGINPKIIKVMPIFCFMICTNISICLTVLEKGLINRNIAREVFEILEEENPVVILPFPTIKDHTEVYEPFEGYVQQVEVKLLDCMLLKLKKYACLRNYY